MFPVSITIRNVPTFLLLVAPFRPTPSHPFFCLSFQIFAQQCGRNNAALNFCTNKAIHFIFIAVNVTFPLDLARNGHQRNVIGTTNMHMQHATRGTTTGTVRVRDRARAKTAASMSVPMQMPHSIRIIPATPTNCLCSPACECGCKCVWGWGRRRDLLNIYYILYMHLKKHNLSLAVSYL